MTSGWEGFWLLEILEVRTDAVMVRNLNSDSHVLLPSGDWVCPLQSSPIRLWSSMAADKGALGKQAYSSSPDASELHS